MALGTFGTKQGSTCSPADVEIISIYSPSRDASETTVMKKLVASDILSPIYHNADTGGNENVELLGGLYNLKLDATEFSSPGIYTLYIRPVQIKTSITDCGVLASLP